MELRLFLEDKGTGRHSIRVRTETAQFFQVIDTDLPPCSGVEPGAQIFHSSAQVAATVMVNTRLGELVHIPRRITRIDLINLKAQS